jgi:hypothetical protein
VMIKYVCCPSSLTHILKQCDHENQYCCTKIEEEGEASEEKHDQVVEKIENILRDQLHCLLSFDEQTMEHIRALVGAYLSLLLENYEQR